MFGSYDVFSIFSRIRFRENYSPREKDQQPSQNNSASTADAPVTNDATAATELLPVAKTVPKDRIELSNAKTPTPKIATPVTYSPEKAKTSKDKAESKDKEQTTDEAQPQNQLLKTKAMAKLDLKMAFSLSDFQQLVTAVAEDAQDGELDTATYSNLNLGFRADLNAQALVKETYKTVEGQDGVTDAQNYKDKVKYNNFETSMVKSRGFEAASFYRESLNSSFKIKQTNRDGFMQVARKLSVRYTQDFALNMQTMGQFNSQAKALDQSGNLQSYLGSTETLVDSPQSSADLIGQFFDTVGTYLDGAEEKLIDKIDGFMSSLASEMGIDSSFLSGAKDSMVSNIRSFFDRVDQAISTVQTNYIPQQPQPETIAPPQNPELSPELVGISEAVAAS